MRTFTNDDAGYAAWVGNPAHADGFVVNSYDPPSKTYAVLHRVQCRTLGRGATQTASGYSKTCSTDAIELDVWARDTLGKPDGPIHRCGLCMKPSSAG